MWKFSASEVTTLWRCRDTFIVVIIIISHTPGNPATVGEVKITNAFVKEFWSTSPLRFESLPSALRHRWLVALRKSIRPVKIEL